MNKADLAAKIKAGLESALGDIPKFLTEILYPPKQIKDFQELFETVSSAESNLKLTLASGAVIDLEKPAPKHGESEPAMFNQVGLYLTPPHGRLIWDGKKTAIIKSIKLKSHIDKPLYLLSGDVGYGIIKMTPPREINLEQFNSSYDKHQISEEERKRWWPDAKILYFYPVSFIRRWDHPKRWKKQQGAQLFVNNVTFLEEQPFGSAILVFTKEKDNEEYKEDETREEGIATEQEKYGDWYKIKNDPKKTYRYVAQHHIRGNSVHTDLRFEVDDHLAGWTLDTPGNKEKKSKFLDPVSPSAGVDYQILTQQKLIQPKVWLTVKGRIEAGGIGATKFKPAEFEIISTGRVRFGTQKHDFHEYFFDPDAKWNQEKTIKGRWIISHIPRPQHYQRAGEGKMMWAMFKPLEQKPYVEYQDLDESIEKAKKEKGYVLWQHPFKGLEKEEDFREGKKKTWIY